MLSHITTLNKHHTVYLGDLFCKYSASIIKLQKYWNKSY